MRVDVPSPQQATNIVDIAGQYHVAISSQKGYMGVDNVDRFGCSAQVTD